MDAVMISLHFSAPGLDLSLTSLPIPLKEGVGNPTFVSSPGPLPFTHLAKFQFRCGLGNVYLKCILSLDFAKGKSKMHVQK